jgi:signal transduction histidine kinase
MSQGNRTYLISASLFLLSTFAIAHLFVEHNLVSLMIAIASSCIQFSIPHIQQHFFDLERARRDDQRDAEISRMTMMADQQRESGKLLIRRDLELTRANDQLRVLDQMKTDFVTIATHQLRTPLTAIRWILSMFLHGDLGALTDDQRTYIMKAYESNNRMVTLLSNMLTAEKLNSEKVRIDPSAYTTLPDLVDNLLTEIRPIAEKRTVALEFVDRKEHYPLARIDPQNMRAILQNLLENAIKYTLPGGRVTIGVQEQADSLVFSVTDSGIGIPAQQQRQIFTRFYRAKNAVQMETDGSGLGLYIVKGIVEKFKGDISFQSTEGKGTIFRVVIPAMAQQITTTKTS